jgi:hypothetical protein
MPSTGNLADSPKRRWDQFSLRSLLCFVAAVGVFAAMARRFQFAGFAGFVMIVGSLLTAAGTCQKRIGRIGVGLCCLGSGGLFLWACCIEDYWIWAYVNLYRHPVLAAAFLLFTVFSFGAALGGGIGLVNRRPTRAAIVGGILAGGVLAVVSILVWGLFWCEAPWNM